MNYAFAERVSYMQSSTIRELLKVTENPEMISLAGGLPAPELFPLAELRESYCRVLSDDPSVLQYSSTEGYLPLREYLASYMNRKGLKAKPDNVFLSNGSQQGLDLLGKIFIDPGDTILVEEPTYFGAIQAFSSYQARYIPVALNEDGIDLQALEQAIKIHRPKFVYLAPTFQNPTGISYNGEKRKQLINILSTQDTLLIEDNPYEELRYRGSELPPLKSFDQDDKVIYLGTFSKTISPGLRLGWIIAGRDIINKLLLAKQGTDLHTSTLLQRATYDYLSHYDVAGHLEQIRSEYGKRCEAMLEALNTYLGKRAVWTKPAGGMFVWATLPDGYDTGSLLQESIKHNVAYVPGAQFFANGGGQNTMRLNFSNAAPAQICEGIKRFAALIA